MKTKKPKFKECDIVEFIEPCAWSKADNIKKGDYLMIDNIYYVGGVYFCEFVFEDRFDLKNIKKSYSYLFRQLKLVKRLIK